MKKNRSTTPNSGMANTTQQRSSTKRPKSTRDGRTKKVRSPKSVPVTMAMPLWEVPTGFASNRSRRKPMTVKIRNDVILPFARFCAMEPPADRISRARSTTVTVRTSCATASSPRFRRKWEMSNAPDAYKPKHRKKLEYADTLS